MKQYNIYADKQYPMHDVYKILLHSALYSSKDDITNKLDDLYRFFVLDSNDPPTIRKRVEIQRNSNGTDYFSLNSKFMNLLSLL